MDINEILIYLLAPTGQIAIIIGLAEAAKKLGVPTKYIPLVDLVLGILSGIVVFGVLQGQHIIASIVLGIAMGLTACGLYSGTKNLIEG